MIDIFKRQINMAGTKMLGRRKYIDRKYALLRLLNSRQLGVTKFLILIFTLP